MKKLLFAVLMIAFVFEGCKKDDASPSTIEGCMDEAATNYNEDATVDDQSCEFGLDDDDDGDGDVNLPLANFSYTFESTVAPILVSFTNNSANSDVYIWDFGDGESSTDENPVHIYNTGGDYTVSLTASTADYEDLITEQINIPDAPSTLIINKIKIVAMPLINSDGNNWDSGLFEYVYPDVFYSLMSGNTELASSSSQDNIQSLPIEFTDNLPFTLTNLYTEYSIELWDNDILVGVGSNEYIGLCRFTPADYIPSTGDEEYLIGIPINENDGITMILEVGWE